MITTTYRSPLGDLKLVADERGLCGLWLSDFVPGEFAAELLIDMCTGELSATDDESLALAAGVFPAGEIDDVSLCLSVDAAPVEYIDGRDAESGCDFLDSAHPSNSAAISVLERAWAWLNSYFAGQAPLWVPPLHMDGGELMHSVCVEALCIPYGETCPFDEFAERVSGRLGLGGSCDADDVLGALLDIPVSIVVPVHRIVAAGESLQCPPGYCEAVDRMGSVVARLLELEERAQVR